MMIIVRTLGWGEVLSGVDLQVGRCEGVDWIELAQERDRWRTLVNAVKNLRVPYNVENLLTS